MFRLLAQQAMQLTVVDRERLEAAILLGPPRDMYQKNMDPEEWQGLVAHSVWLRLSKLKASNISLGANAAARLAEISNTYPGWQLMPHESEEFSHWMSGTGDPDFEDNRVVDIAPRNRQELVPWLKKPAPERRPFYEDTWPDVCSARFFHSLAALCDLGRDGAWPARRWREALQAWAGEGAVSRSWKYAAPLVQTIPDGVIQEISHSLTWWMEAASKVINCHEEILLKMCLRIIALPPETGSESRSIRNGVEIYDPVSAAINHPIGHVTQALVNIWFKNNPGDNELLPENLKPIFTRLCDVQEDRFRHGRVLLGSQLIAFFRGDRLWSEQHLLPLFSWSNPAVAKAVWGGFLWSPRLYQPLMVAFKPHFLESANHYVDLGVSRHQFSAFLTYAALGPAEGYTSEEFRTAIGALPGEGLEESAQALFQAVESAGDRCEEYWKNRAHPFWQQVWPKSRDAATPRIAESLARLCIAARGEFPAALAAVQNWLQAIDHTHYIVHLLAESSLCKKFPSEALLLLHLVIVEEPWISGELGQCLDEILLAAPQLLHDTRYQGLREYSRKRGAQQ